MRPLRALLLTGLWWALVSLDRITQDQDRRRAPSVLQSSDK